jgi:hypothetical protein
LWACFVGAPELFRQLCLTGVESTEIELLLVAGRLELAEGPELELLVVAEETGLELLVVAGELELVEWSFRNLSLINLQISSFVIHWRS